MASNMKKTLLFLVALFMVAGLQAQECGPFQFRNYSIMDTSVLKLVESDTFQLSSNYPTEMPETSRMPWERIDFKKKPEQFMKEVLNYCWEGNEEVDFIVQRNETRTWYHAPFLDQGYAGREPMHGLVMDNTSFGEDFAGEKKGRARNYKITFYNDIAAYTLGQVWCDPNNPDATKTNFAEGAVIFSLVFTTGDSTMFPFLTSPYSWEAFVEESVRLPIEPKGILPIHLFEVDFQVRTEDAPTGWVAGSFIFDGLQGESAQERLVPVSLAWGNDPGDTPAMVRDEENPAAIDESWINESVHNAADAGNSMVRHQGYGGRAQRPIGLREGAILSELMTSGWPISPAIAPENIEIDSVMYWFRNIEHGQPFMAGQIPLDFSQELRDGLWLHAISRGDSMLSVQYQDHLSDLLGFVPPDRSRMGQGGEEEEEFVGDVDEGLEGRNLYVFIGFVILVVVIIGLLIWNLIQK